MKSTAKSVEPVYEVELKFPLPDPAGWERHVAQHIAMCGVVWSDAVIERDIFLQHPSRDFVQTDEALRIRTTIFADTQTARTLTYKGAKIHGMLKSRREIELVINDGAWNELFAVLGFVPAAEVVKRRRTASLTHAGRVWTLTRDTLLECEAYLECREWCELETLATTADITEASRLLETFAADLSLKNGTRRSYLEGSTHCKFA